MRLEWPEIIIDPFRKFWIWGTSSPDCCGCMLESRWKLHYMFWIFSQKLLAIPMLPPLPSLSFPTPIPYPLLHSLSCPPSLVTALPISSLLLSLLFPFPPFPSLLPSLLFLSYLLLASFSLPFRPRLPSHIFIFLLSQCLLLFLFPFSPLFPPSSRLLP